MRNGLPARTTGSEQSEGPFVAGDHELMLPGESGVRDRVKNLSGIRLATE